MSAGNKSLADLLRQLEADNAANIPISPELLSAVFGTAPNPALTQSALDAIMRQPSPTLPPLVGLAASPPGGLGALGLAAGFENHRTRSSWNARLEAWEKAASDSEEGRIESARRDVAAAVRNNAWLTNQGVTIGAQGSYFNNTNVRLDADMDIRVRHPSLYIEYAQNVHVPSARGILQYYDLGMTYDQIFSGMRSSLVTALGDVFGARNIDASGGKAIRIKGTPGGRAEVDVVPCCAYQRVTWLPWLKRYDVVHGVAILDRTGRWTINYPDQHHANGKTKRSNTTHRFKKIVRMLKRMRNDMEDRKTFTRNVPSFLVESLVYCVADGHFNVATDDRYDRLRRVALAIQAMLRDAGLVAQMLEVNGLKPLFGAGQSWDVALALAFINAVVTHLGDA